jgi:hypothetical protein
MLVGGCCQRCASRITGVGSGPLCADYEERRGEGIWLRLRAASGATSRLAKDDGPLSRRVRFSDFSSRAHGINLIVAVLMTTGLKCSRCQPGLNEANFWAPSGASFRALKPGELFLFKLHAPRNVIVGGGIFAYANVLPCSLA